MSRVIERIVNNVSNLRGPRGVPGPHQPGPWLGVTDGSLTTTSPGYKGELRQNTVSGNFTNITTQGTLFSSLFLTGLPAGCWDLWWSLNIFGSQVSAAYCMLDPSAVPAPPTDIPNNLLGWAVVINNVFVSVPPMPSVPLMCPPTPYSNTAQALLVFRVVAYSAGNPATVPSAPFTFTSYARRMR